MARSTWATTFDIHGGGKDLVFPHHENEIAQSEAASGQELARTWLHNGFVTLDHEKMSKSLGNFKTIRDLLEHWDGEALRAFLLSTHYRHPINFSAETLAEADRRVDYFYDSLAKADGYVAQKKFAGEGARLQEHVDAFREAMDDDFNTADAIARIERLFGLLNARIDAKGKPDEVASLARTGRELLQTLGLAGRAPSEAAKARRTLAQPARASTSRGSRSASAPASPPARPRTLPRPTPSAPKWARRASSFATARRARTGACCCSPGLPGALDLRPHALQAAHRLQAARRSAPRHRRARDGLKRGDKHQTLLGVTGSGKTFTMANVIAQRAAAHAGHRAQQDAGGAALRRVQELFPDNAVEYFVSYYDYYQPEAYVPSTRHLHRERLDHQRRDRPPAPRGDALAADAQRRPHRRVRLLHLRPRHGRGLLRTGRSRSTEGQEYPRATSCCATWSRSSTSATTSTSTAAPSGCAATPSRSSRPTKKSAPSAWSSSATTSRRITEIDPLRGKSLGKLEKITIFPVQPLRRPGRAPARAPSLTIRDELRGAADELCARSSKLLEAQRLEQRTMFDLEMIEQMGFCNGIENYSRHLTGPARRRSAARACSITSPRTSCSSSTRAHQTVPQIGAHVPRRPRAQGDAGRVRLPPAVGARQPAAQLRGVRERWSTRSIYVSATPGRVRAAEEPRAWSSSRSSGPRA